MTDREPNRLLKVHVDERGHVTTEGGRTYIGSTTSRAMFVHPDDLLPLPVPQPCVLGCTVECPTCEGTRDVTNYRGGARFGDTLACTRCTNGTVPAVHASEAECRPRLPEGWGIQLNGTGRPHRMYEWNIYSTTEVSVRSGREPTVTEREAAISEACRRIARQHARQEQP